MNSYATTNDLNRLEDRLATTITDQGNDLRKQIASVKAGGWKTATLLLGLMGIIATLAPHVTIR